MNNRTEDEENIVYAGGDEEAAERNQLIRDRITKEKRILWIAAAVGVILLIILANVIKNKQYHGYKVVSSTELEYENSAGYVKFCDNLLKYTADGVSYIDQTGTTVWSAGINMSMPVVETCGNYAVVADVNGNSVCVFNREGNVNSLTMPYTICDVDVAKQGAFAVVLESEKTNYVNLYDRTGNAIYEMQTTLDKSGYPLDISISDDGKKLLTSYINVAGAVAETNLAAYNFGDVGQNSNADRMVGGYKFADEIIPKVEFVDNDTVLAFGTKSIIVYAMKEKPSEKATLHFDQEIQSIFSCEEYFGVIQKMESENGEPKYRCRAYDFHGREKFDETIDFAYNNIFATKDELLISGGSKCIILRPNGSVKFEADLDGNVISIVPSGKNNEYIVVYDSRTDVIKLRADLISNAQKKSKDDIVTNSKTVEDDSEEEAGNSKEEKTTEEITTEEVTIEETVTEEATENQP